MDVLGFRIAPVWRGFAVSVLLLGAASVRAVEPDPLFDFPALTNTPLNAKTLSITETNGIVTEEVMFHSEMDGDKSVDIYAILCHPKDGTNLPAFVWCQAGLGKATAHYPAYGAKRGYLALCFDYPLPGYRSTGGYPIDLSLPDDLKKSGVYHTAVAVLKAVSYLQSRPDVDPNRIGVGGLSWGGFFATLMAGIDPRLKAVSSMFGCGALQLGNAWWDGQGWNPKMDAAYRERWKTTLDPAWRLQTSKVPIGWFTGTDDVFYWMPALMRSYDMAAGPKCLSLLPNWNHDLNRAVHDQLFDWLDVYLQGRPPFISVSPVQVVNQHGRLFARWTFTPVEGRPMKSAELILSYGDSGNWHSRPWITLPAKVKDRQCEVELPATAVPYFISGTIVDDREYRYSTPLARVAPSELGIKRPRAKPDYDGCATWGDFEAPHLAMQRSHGYRIPPLGTDAHDGTQCAVLTNGTTSLLPIFFTAGLPHRLTCYLKSAAPTETTLRLVGTFDGKNETAEKTVPVGSEWSAATLDFQPPPALAGQLTLTVTVPAGAEVLLDTIRFQPVPKGK